MTIELQQVIDNLKFKPVNRFFNQGNEIQRCVTKYKNVEILWETIFPYNIFKDPIDSFLVDLIVKDTLEIPNGRIIEGYCDEGYGYPVFNTLEDAISYIDNFKIDKA